MRISSALCVFLGAVFAVESCPPAVRLIRDFENIPVDKGDLRGPIARSYFGLYFNGFTAANPRAPAVVPRGEKYVVTNIIRDMNDHTATISVFDGSIRSLQSFSINSFAFSCALHGVTVIPPGEEFDKAVACEVFVTGYRTNDGNINSATATKTREFKFNGGSSATLPMSASGDVSADFSEVQVVKIRAVFQDTRQDDQQALLSIQIDDLDVTIRGTCT